MIYTPAELHHGLWLKREDLHRLPCGVNGAKLRACQHLLHAARERGFTRVISAASVLSPQNAMAAVVAREYGMSCEVIVGATTPATAFRHPAMQIAREAGAHFNWLKVGYNPALQRAARQLRDVLPGSYLLNYGITPGPEAEIETLRAFHAVGADQVRNLPAMINTLVVPFGSGNSAAGVLYGLAQQHPAALQRVVLMGIGPDRKTWLNTRLQQLDVKLPVPLEHVSLYPHFARYSDKMPATLDGVIMHPTYEGKIVVWAMRNKPDWWLRRDLTTCLWIVGGPLN